jgi:hypothetical protein
MKNTYLVKFERFFSNKPSMVETVWVVLETNTTNGNNSIEQFESEAYDALWIQYPLWKCPYSSNYQPPTEFERVRHGWSSVFITESILI